jgi:phospholipid/cholesterol/gamma-HCH transport system substrate-binding protein
VADLRELQPILSQLAASGPDLANSLDLLLTYPFPAKSLDALVYRKDANTGGYGLFTNMTATLNLDLRETLCRYAVDPVTGELKVLPEQDLTGGQCGQPGTPPSNQSSTSTTSRTVTLPGVPGKVLGALVSPLTGAAEQATGAIPGLPALPAGGSK